MRTIAGFLSFFCRSAHALLAVMLLTAIAHAQDLQRIEPGDSILVQRQKVNANFTLVYTKAIQGVSNTHTHPNKTFLDGFPVLFGSANQYLRINAAHNGFDLVDFVGGTGITVSHVGGQTIISLNNANGITSLNGQLGATQTFVNGDNVTITSSGNHHTLGFQGTLAGLHGGTGSAFIEFTGPNSTLKHFNLPNLDNVNILTDAAPVTTNQGGSGVAGALSGILKGNGASPFTAITDSAGIAAAISDETGAPGSLVFNGGPTIDAPWFTTVARMNSQAPFRFYDLDSSNYLGWKAPATVTVNKDWIMPPSSGAANNYVLTLVDASTGETQWAAAPGSSGGEANTASNVGNAGQGMFKSKVGVNLGFYNLAPASNKVAVALDSSNNNVTVDVNQANLDHALIGGVATVPKGGSGANTFTPGILVANNTSPFSTVPAPTSAVAGVSDVQTFTNKTIDCEAAGNNCITVSKIWLDVAGCDGGSNAYLTWDSFSTNAPSAACLAGTNVVKGVGSFPDGSTDLSIQRTIALPGDFSGNVDVKFNWLTTATTGNVIWGAAAACSGDGQLDDPAFNPWSDVADIAKGTASQLNDASVSSINISGCSGGKLLHLKVARRLSQSGDTVAAAALLVGVEVTLRRTQ